MDSNRWALQSLPGKSGFPLNISASTQPTLQTSMERVYSLKVSMTSGARYHLKTNCHSWIKDEGSRGN